MIVAYLCVYKSKKNYNPKYIHKSNIKIYKEIYIYIYIYIYMHIYILYIYTHTHIYIYMWYSPLKHF